MRVNGLGTKHFERDLEAIVGPGLDIVNLPKPESADDIRACAKALTRVERKAKVEPIDILANIESPGRCAGRRISARQPRVVGLQAEDGET